MTDQYDTLDALHDHMGTVSRHQVGEPNDREPENPDP